MNLKEAAHRLGVHYQTAYKWVRRGELQAIRVGGRYDVSDAAIERFHAQRSALRAGSDATEEAVGESSAPTEMLAALDAMGAEALLSERSVLTFAGARAATVFGDLCVVVRFDERGDPEFMTVQHPDPTIAATITAAIDLLGPASLTPGFAYSAFSEQRLVRFSHVPQDLVRDQIRPELRQHIPRTPIRSLLSVPIEVRETPQGAMTLARSDPDRPHTDAEALLAIETGIRIGRLLETAADVKVAVEARRRLVTALTRAVEFRPTESLERAVDLGGLVDDLGVALPIAVLDPEHRYLAVNARFHEVRGRGDDVIGTVFDSETPASEREAEQAGFERLASGELDYLDSGLRRMLPSGRTQHWVSHRAAVRAPDASLRGFVLVGRPTRLAVEDAELVRTRRG